MSTENPILALLVQPLELLKQYRETMAAHAALDHKEETLHAERQRLIESGLFDDKKTVEAASTISIEAAMVPFKRVRLEKRADELSQALGTPCRAARQALEEDLNNVEKQLRLTQENALKPLIT